MEQDRCTVHDVAAYIIEKCGPMTTTKLQKLVYYAQAWSLAIDDHLLFDATIKAWKDGPVVPDLFHNRPVRVASPGRMERTGPSWYNQPAATGRGQEVKDEWKPTCTTHHDMPPER